MMFAGFRSPWAQSSAIMPAARASNDSARLRSFAVQGHALDPVAQNRVDPDARFRRGVEEKFFFQQFVAINLPQVAHFAQVAAQRTDAPVAADAEDDGRIADAVTGPAPFVQA